jgi:hypothetical protein
MSAPEVLVGGSIGVNPTVADIDINQAATDFLWAVFAIMLFSDLVFLFFSYRVCLEIILCAFWALLTRISSAASSRHPSVPPAPGPHPHYCEHCVLLHGLRPRLCCRPR